MPNDLRTVSDSTPQPQARPGEPAWKELCAVLNGLRRVAGNWWRQMTEDDEAVPRVDESAVAVRIRGNVLAEISLCHGAPQCRIEPEHLLLAHPGARAVLGEGETEVRAVRTLGELAGHFGQVRRRACRHTDRRQAVLDRLFLRHACVLAVDAPFGGAPVDLVAMSPQGMVVFFLLRRYADADLRLRGRGGVGWRMTELDRRLADTQAAAIWVHDLLERCAALDTRHCRRYRVPRHLHIHPHARLMVVDFDHAQRQAGLDALRADLEDGLDRSGARSDIHCLGDAGNISFGTFFSGI